MWLSVDWGRPLPAAPTTRTCARAAFTTSVSFAAFPSREAGPVTPAEPLQGTERRAAVHFDHHLHPCARPVSFTDLNVVGGQTPDNAAGVTPWCLGYTTLRRPSSAKFLSFQRAARR
jgi:hypothetical protein